MKREAYRDEGYRLMGAAFEVYNNRGYGLAEEIYQAMHGNEIRAIPFHSKAELTCLYKGRRLKKHYIPDLIVYSSLSAIKELWSGNALSCLSSSQNKVVKISVD